MGYYYAQGKSEEIKMYFGKSFRFVWMLSIPMCFGIFAVSDNFVPWFFGEGYDGVIPILRIFSLLIIATGINNVIGLQYLIPTGRHNYYTICVIIGAAVNLICNFLLIPRMGAVGATMASVLAEFCIAIVEFYFIRREISISLIIKSAGKYILSGFVMLAIVLIISKHLSSSIINTMIIAISGVAVYSIMLLILKDQFFMGNMKTILKKMHVIKG